VKSLECHFCRQNGHVVGGCQFFLKEDINSRWMWVKTKSVCFSCLKFGHQARACRARKPCKKDGCEMSHHPTLHNFPPNEGDEAFMGLASDVQGHSTVLLKILPVTLKGPAGEVSTFALLDGGSTRSLIDSKTAKQLGLRGPQQAFHFNGVKGIHQYDPYSEKVSLTVSNPEGQSFALKDVQTITNLMLPSQSVPMPNLATWKNCAAVNIKGLRRAVPTILLGEDNADIIVSREVREGPPDAPILSRTKLGWVLHGPSST
jgi:hypothetical protein